MYGFADRLRKKGRFGDTLVAHLSEGEARLLRRMGGSGTTNPFTGAVEFYKGTMDGPVPSFYQSLLPDSNLEVAVDPEVEDVPRSGLDGFYKSIEKMQNANKPKKESGVNPRMLSFAKIMQNTFDRDDPGTDGELRAEYYEGSKSIENMLKYTKAISGSLHNKLIDRGVDGHWNEDKAPGRVDEVIAYMFRKNDDGDNAFEVSGGQDELLKAYKEIGVTGEGKSYADKHVKNLMKEAEKITKEFDLGQTSLNMGKDPGPKFAGEFTGPTAWSDYLDAVAYALEYQLPFSPTMKGMQAKEISERLKISFTEALNLAMGMPQYHGLGGIGVVGLGSHNYGSSPVRDDASGNNPFGV